MRQIDEMTQHNAALVEQINASIEQTEGQAVELDSVVDRFTIETPPQSRATTSPAAAAQRYRSRGTAARSADWNEF